jgi:hypothetical protein
MIRIFYREAGFLMFSLVLLNFSCQQHENKLDILEWSEINSSEIINQDFMLFCEKKRQDMDLEHMAVLSSFVGEHELSLQYTGQRMSGRQDFDMVMESKEFFLYQAKNALQSENLTDSERENLSLVINLASRSDDLDEVFGKHKPIDAVKFIESKAGDFHFLMINEGHFNGQNRMLTLKMLRPLWEKGYRYLALETLSYGDESLVERGYPISNTGYYSRESTFGNLIREAIEIGYQLIPYETRNDLHGTSRDEDMAYNILSQTLQKDTVGKVLVHVGYSHLNENWSEDYTPLGAFLKQMTGNDILTVDQERMVDLLQNNHPYYEHAIRNFNFSQPSVFVKEGQVLIDPINAIGVDIQVFHPEFKKVNGRPKWIVTDEYLSYSLPEEFAQYYGHLVRARFIDEDEQAVPVDQFIIQQGRNIVLKKGTYRVDIIDFGGCLVASAVMEAG